MDFNLALFCENDAYAEKSYCAIHHVDSSLNIGDATRVGEQDVPDFNTMFGGTPCQEFSICGKRTGAVWACRNCGHAYNPISVHYSKRNSCPACGSTEIDKSKSSLIVEWLRFLRAKRPRFALYENVKNLLGVQFKPTFDMFLSELDEYGYNVYWQILNAVDYNVPQNRERVYCVIVRKDLDNHKFGFPTPIPLTTRLSDLMDDKVDKRYYLDEEKLKTITKMKGASMSDGACVRKLTPKEAFRVMGFSETDYEHVTSQGYIPEGHLYKQAGNSIVVDVLRQILQSLHQAMPYLFDDLRVGSFFSGIGAFEKALETFDLIHQTNTEQSFCKYTQRPELTQIGYINGYNGDANRIYDSTVARTLKAEAGGGGAKTGWYCIDKERMHKRDAY